jgi:hypothetical protein
MVFTARFARDAGFTERNSFFFSGERPEKKRSNRVMAMKIMATPIKICFEQDSV